MAATAEYTVRDCAKATLDAIERYGSDYARLSEAIKVPFLELMKRPDLITLGVKRESNHTSAAWQLYYDGVVSLRLDKLNKGVTIPPHDHGVWEVLAVWRGRYKHTVYRRIDNEQKPSYAELEVVDERILDINDFVLVAPPSDIHTFTALEDTYHLNVIGGEYKPDRHYYQPEQKTYFITNTKVPH